MAKIRTKAHGNLVINEDTKQFERAESPPGIGQMWYRRLKVFRIRKSPHQDFLIKISPRHEDSVTLFFQRHSQIDWVKFFLQYTNKSPFHSVRIEQNEYDGAVQRWLYEYQGGLCMAEQYEARERVIFIYKWDGTDFIFFDRHESEYNVFKSLIDDVLEVHD